MKDLIAQDLMNAAALALTKVLSVTFPMSAAERTRIILHEVTLNQIAGMMQNEMSLDVVVTAAASALRNKMQSETVTWGSDFLPSGVGHLRAQGGARAAANAPRTSAV